jgi:hypothetical protein
VFN